MVKTLSGTLFKNMIANGAANLKNNHQEINSLNVFPVPDGDTGTNMQMTIMAGTNEAVNTNSKSIVDVSKILSRGCLMGARGNSGVILSQFFRGLYSKLSIIKNGSATIDEFIDSLVGGYEMAYKAVMTPVEGTILTVVRESAEAVKARRSEIDSIEDVLKIYLEEATKSLDRTPEILPVLKEAGVVDAGGAGFIKIIEGMLLAVQGEKIEILDEPIIHEMPKEENIFEINQEDIKFGYCTEFIVKLYDQASFNQKTLQGILENMGDSLVLVQDEELLKVHVHTNQPGVIITLGQKYGELQTMKVDNMRLQNSAMLESFDRENVIDDNALTDSDEVFQLVNEERVNYGIIAVASGVGIKKVFKELGVHYIIDGGQTMNPPTDEFVKAIEELNADNIIILPNNGNIILTAEQAAQLVEDSNVRVLKTKSIPGGYFSMMMFDETLDIDENMEVMTEALSSVKTGELTYSVKDTTYNGFEIKKGDFIGITGGKIVASAEKRIDSMKKLIDELIDEETEITSIFYGRDVELSEAEEISEYIYSINPHVEIELIDGRQDIYSYIIAAE